jgi:hypothetical protein
VRQPRSVYVVFGETGRYDDYLEWPVRAFYAKAAAGRFALRCGAHVERMPDTRKGAGKWGDEHPLDPDFRFDMSTGTKYTVKPVPLGPMPRTKKGRRR